MLARCDLARIAEIEAELATLRIGKRPVLADVLPATRRLLDADNTIFYALADADAGLRLDRWFHDGNASTMQALLVRSLESGIDRVVFYDPSRPPPSMRNRVVEATAWIDRSSGPGTWLHSRMCREVFAPLGMQRHKHVRVLLCEGGALLGWFGTLLPDTPTPRQLRALTALIPALRRRLALERRFEAAPRTLGALDTALERIGVPAFIVTARGVICQANAAARTLLARRRADLAEAIEAARLGRPHPLRVELTPVATDGMAGVWLAIVRAPAIQPSLAQAVAAAAARWSLSARRRAILARVVLGDTNQTIAAELGITTRAVELHVTALLERAQVANRTALVALVLGNLA